MDSNDPMEVENSQASQPLVDDEIDEEAAMDLLDPASQPLEVQEDLGPDEYDEQPIDREIAPTQRPKVNENSDDEEIPITKSKKPEDTEKEELGISWDSDDSGDNLEKEVEDMDMGAVFAPEGPEMSMSMDPTERSRVAASPGVLPLPSPIGTKVKSVLNYGKNVMNSPNLSRKSNLGSSGGYDSSFIRSATKTPYESPHPIHNLASVPNSPYNPKNMSKSFMSPIPAQNLEKIPNAEFLNFSPGGNASIGGSNEWNEPSQPDQRNKSVEGDPKASENAISGSNENIEFSMFQQDGAEEQPEENKHQPLNKPIVLKKDSVYRAARTQLVSLQDFLQMPCRDEEQQKIFRTISDNLKSGLSATIYISGTPGTGKTATVRAVHRNLENLVAQGKLPSFKFIEINGLKLIKPDKAYSLFWNRISGEQINPVKALAKLSQEFKNKKSTREMIVLLLDEIDMLQTKDQSILYNFFDWPRTTGSKLIIIAISNTLDLPEKFDKKIASRMGSNQVVFRPYQAKHLEEILKARLGKRFLNLFDDGALTLLSKKIASSSSDARRAVQIARKALFIAEDEFGRRPTSTGPATWSDDLVRVTMDHVSTSVEDLFSDPRVELIPTLSEHERLFICALLLEGQQSSGDAATVLGKVMLRYWDLEALHNFQKLNSRMLSIVYNNLASLSYIGLEKTGRNNPDKGLQRGIFLEMDRDDIVFALRDDEIAVKVFGRQFFSK